MKALERENKKDLVLFEFTGAKSYKEAKGLLSKFILIAQGSHINEYEKLAKTLINCSEDFTLLFIKHLKKLVRLVCHA